MKTKQPTYRSVEWRRAGYEKAKRAITFFFLLYFFFYAITPLSHNFINRSSHEMLTHECTHDSTILHLYVLDVIGAYISHASPENASDDSSFLVLLKKKRAVLSETSLTKCVKTFSCALTDHDLFLAPPFAADLSLFPDKDAFRSTVFPSHSSGLSPPLA